MYVQLYHQGLFPGSNRLIVLLIGPSWYYVGRISDRWMVNISPPGFYFTRPSMLMQIN